MIMAMSMASMMTAMLIRILVMVLVRCRAREAVAANGGGCLSHVLATRSELLQLGVNLNEIVFVAIFVWLLAELVVDRRTSCYF